MSQYSIQYYPPGRLCLTPSVSLPASRALSLSLSLSRCPSLYPSPCMSLSLHVSFSLPLSPISMPRLPLDNTTTTTNNNNNTDNGTITNTSTRLPPELTRPRRPPRRRDRLAPGAPRRLPVVSCVCACLIIVFIVRCSVFLFFCVDHGRSVLSVSYIYIYIYICVYSLIRPISLVRVSLLRFVASNFPGSSLWA